MGAAAVCHGEIARPRSCHGPAGLKALSAGAGAFERQSRPPRRARPHCPPRRRALGNRRNRRRLQRATFNNNEATVQTQTSVGSKRKQQLFFFANISPENQLRGSTGAFVSVRRAAARCSGCRDGAARRCRLCKGAAGGPQPPWQTSAALATPTSVLRVGRSRNSCA